MRIGELSRRTGASVRMLRYYEAQGLLAAGRGSNRYREFGEDAPLVVGQIRGLLDAGLSTSAIADVLPCARGGRPELDMCPSLRARLHRYLADLDSTIESLSTNRDALRGYLAYGTEPEPDAASDARTS